MHFIRISFKYLKREKLDNVRDYDNGMVIGDNLFLLLISPRSLSP